MIAVITTIQPPTASALRLVKRLQECDCTLVVVGDKKGPLNYPTPHTTFLSLQDQIDSPFSLARLLPTGHYTRKNVGYLHAIAKGAAYIYETDDDNAPNESWCLRDLTTKARRVGGRRWANVYRMFSDDVIWPRGFPLDLLSDKGSYELAEAVAPVTVEAPIQQGLADISPDVDAVWRLTMCRDFRFERRPSVWLAPGTWCPFNSQTTWWWPAAYPLLYLPSFCTFRMTDIWRSFVAQRCLWEMNYSVVFHAPEVDQKRNQHDLMQDFEAEIPGYTLNSKIVSALEALSLLEGPENTGSNMRSCYEAMVRCGFMPADELGLIDCWLEEIKRLEKAPVATNPAT